jgi:uncharacterized protein (TIGR00299 family) protein
LNLHLECATGLSGDMFLAALVDAGLDLSPLQDIFEQIGVQVALRPEKKQKCGLQGTRLDLEMPKKQPLRHLADLTGLIEKMSISPEVREKSIAAFERLAAVEAKVHGVEVSEVHFHEVGAVDTLLDIVGAFWGLEKMGISCITANSLPWFRGTVVCEHGQLPLPAPATLELLRNKPVYPTGYEQELVTPTGALLIDQLVDSFINGPIGKVCYQGIGWGTIDLGQTPNCLRIFAYEQQDNFQDYVWLLESNIDHLTGEEIGGLFDNLFQAGALDVLFLPGVMKKNRPGGLLQVLCTQDKRDAVQEVFFQQGMTLGLRRQKIERIILPRRKASRETPWGTLEVKEMELGGETFSRPEYEAMQRLASKTGRSVAQLRYMLSEQSKNNK